MTIRTDNTPISEFGPPDTVKRNFNLGVANGILYLIAENLMDPTLVIAVFLSQLTSSDLLIGLIIPIRDGLWSIPQLWMSGYLQNLARKMDLFRKVSIIRFFCWLLLAIEINFISDPTILLVSFMVTFTIVCLAAGLSGLAWMEIVSKTIPSEQRGKFFALRLGISGFFNIGFSLFVRWLLSAQSGFQFPHNFGILSILYFLFASTALWAFAMIKEPEETHTLPIQPIHILLKRSINIFKGDKVYRNFVFLLSLMSIGGMATPFFAIYVQQNLGGDPSMVGIYLGVSVVSNLAANILFGRISLVYGNRRVMVISILSGALMSLMVLALVFLAAPLHISAAAASLWLIPVFILFGLRGTGYTISSNCITLDISPSKERSLYVGFINSMTGLVILATGLSGVIKDLLGMEILLLFTFCAHLLSLYLASTIKTKRSALR